MGEEPEVEVVSIWLLDARVLGPILTRSSSEPGDEARMSRPDGEGTMTHIVNKDDLPHSKIAHRFEGHRYGDVDVSFFLVDSPPGGGAVLHTHPYQEIFITLEGNATFTVGDDTIEVSAGQIVVAPADVPHKFVNSGNGPLRQVDIHPSGRIQQVNIPEGS
jgi:mannose-6-phosphate isomerase-like protein (cupin superfamily)